jgi:predicted O-methyltransferase YrrM
MSLINYLNDKNCNIIEGYSRSCYKETIILQMLCIDTKIKNILEIGFNGGHSADLFLKTNTNCNVLSFDIGHHTYVKIAKEFMDKTYPNRHTLVIGDSTKTVPIYQSDIKYDLIFIDGGHSYEVAKADLLNCKRLAHKDTIVIIDDTMYNSTWEQHYNIGPTKAWLECIKQNIITKINQYDFEPGRGLSYGKYVI